MDAKTATEFFGQDLERLRGIAKHLGLRTVEALGERAVTFGLRWRGRALRVVMHGTEDYPLSPTSVRFCSEEDPKNDASEHWPAGVSGINAQERFVCSPGFAEGHQRHSDWPIVTDKNRIHKLAQRLVFILGGVEPDGESEAGPN